jgi:hypothetical protein
MQGFGVKSIKFIKVEFMKAKKKNIIFNTSAIIAFIIYFITYKPDIKWI